MCPHQSWIAFLVPPVTTHTVPCALIHRGSRFLWPLQLRIAFLVPLLTAESILERSRTSLVSYNFIEREAGVLPERAGHSHTHTLKHSHTHTLPHSNTHTLTHSHTSTLTHSRTHTITISHTHTLKHSHAHTLRDWEISSAGPTSAKSKVRSYMSFAHTGIVMQIYVNLVPNT